MAFLPAAADQPSLVRDVTFATVTTGFADLGTSLRAAISEKPPEDWVEQFNRKEPLLRGGSLQSQNAHTSLRFSQKQRKYACASDVVLVFHMPQTADTLNGEPDPSRSDTAKLHKFLRIGSEHSLDCDITEEVREALLESGTSSSAQIGIEHFLDQYLASEKITSAKQVRELVIHMVLDVLCTALCRGDASEDSEQVKLYRTMDGSNLMVILNLREEALLDQASFVSYHFQLGRAEMDEMIGELEYLPENSQLSYVPYCHWYREALRKVQEPGTEPSRGNIMRGVDRIRLVTSLLENQLDLHHLQKLGVFQCAFPAHNRALLFRYKWTFSHWFSHRHRKDWAKSEALEAKEERVRKVTHEGVNPERAEKKGNKVMKKAVAHLTSRRQRIDEVRDYFGERIAFYFAFLDHTLNYLTVLSVVGIGVVLYELIIYDSDADESLADSLCGAFLLLVSGNRWSDHVRAAYGMFICAWAMMFVRHWSRHEAELGNAWGTDRDFVNLVLFKSHSQHQSQHKSQNNTSEAISPSRSRSMTARNCWRKLSNHKCWPQCLKLFRRHGEAHHSQGTMSDTEWHRKRIARRASRAMSFMLTMLFAGLVVYAVVSIMRWRGHLVSEGRNIAAHLTSLPLSALTQVVTNIWPIIAEQLTHREHRRLENDFLEWCSLKVFVVDFVSSFTANFYTAFLQEWIETLDGQPPKSKEFYMSVLVINAEVIFGIYVSACVWDIVKPFIKMKWRMTVEARKCNKAKLEFSFLESQLHKCPYSGDDESMDYEQILLPLAFVMLFGLTMPLAAPLACLAVKAQAKADAWKLVNMYRRPYPSFAKGIGGWRVSLLGNLCALSVACNLGLMVFRLRIFNVDVKTGMPELPLDFFVWEHAAVAIVVIVWYFVPTESEFVKDERVRQGIERQRLNAERGVLHQCRKEMLVSRANATAGAHEPKHFRRMDFLRVSTTVESEDFDELITEELEEEANLE